MNLRRVQIRSKCTAPLIHLPTASHLTLILPGWMFKQMIKLQSTGLFEHVALVRLKYMYVSRQRKRQIRQESEPKREAEGITGALGSK